MGMITIAQSVYRNYIEENLMNQSLLINLALELDNKINSKVNDNCPFFRVTSPSL